MPVLESGYITRLHVNQHVIKANTKTGSDDPVFSIKHRGKTIKARSVTVTGEMHMKYNSNPLSCGARVWLETTSPITYEE